MSHVFTLITIGPCTVFKHAVNYTAPPLTSAGPKGGQKGHMPPPEATTRHTLPPEKKLILIL